MARLHRTIAALAVLATIAAAPAQAQMMHDGGVSGTITSETGDVLAGVVLTLTCYGVAHEAVSDDEGAYSFAAINPAPCLLTAELDGFVALHDVAVDIKVARVITIDLVMVPEETPRPAEVGAA